MEPEKELDPLVLKLWRIRGFMNSIPMVVIALVYNFFSKSCPIHHCRKKVSILPLLWLCLEDLSLFMHCQHGIIGLGE